jgi:eukaryotic translation initiation factor 2C
MDDLTVMVADTLVVEKPIAKNHTRQLIRSEHLFCIQFLKEGVTLGPWAVAVFDSRCNDGQRVADQLVESCCRRGMKMGKAAGVEKEPYNAMGHPPEQRVEQMIQALKRWQPEFVLVILPDKDSPIYG